MDLLNNNKSLFKSAVKKYIIVTLEYKEFLNDH